MSRIYIHPAARDDAKKIEQKIKQMDADLKDLKHAITTHIPANIQTKWSAVLKEKWMKYYTSDIPTALGEMLLSAQNITIAANQAEAMSNNVGTGG